MCNLYMNGMRDQGGSRSICDLSKDSIRGLVIDFVRLKIRSKRSYSIVSSTIF